MIIGYEAKRIFHNRSGLGNYGRNLLGALARYYPENTYVLYNPNKGAIAFGEDERCFKEVRPAVKSKLLKNLWRQKLVSKQAANEGIQIFHGLSHELPADLTRNGLKSVVTIHDLIFMRYPGLYKWIDRKIYLKKVKLAVKRADVVVAISKQTKHDLIELLHVPETKIKVIYQGCAQVFKEPQTPEAQSAVQQQYNLPDEYLLFVGTLEERKNVHLILEALLKLHIPTVFIGKKTRFWNKLMSSPNYASIKHLIYTPRVEDNTHLAAIYQKAKLFVYPSLFEGFGIPVLEALESGTPVITSNRSSLPEAAGPHACLVEVDNAKKLTQAIADIWHDEARRSEMTLQGKVHAAHFSDSVLSKQWITLYQNLLA
jgi:glycosyltransferase involved in cell wall biosynthesis